MENKTFEIRDHTPSIADVCSGAVTTPTSMGKWLSANPGRTWEDWARQTATFADIGSDRPVLVVSLQQSAYWFRHAALYQALNSDFIWLVFFGRRVIVVNQDGTRSAELTSLLTDIGGMLIKWWTWESDGSGVGTSGF